MRAVLECSAIPKSSIEVVAEALIGSALVDDVYYKLTSTATAPLPAGCRSSSEGEGGSDNITIESTTYIYRYMPDGQFWMGYLEDLSVILTPGSPSLEGCPSLGLIYSRCYVEDWDSAEIDHTTIALICS